MMQEGPQETNGIQPPHKVRCNATMSVPPIVPYTSKILHSPLHKPVHAHVYAAYFQHFGFHFYSPIIFSILLDIWIFGYLDFWIFVLNFDNLKVTIPEISDTDDSPLVSKHHLINQNIGNEEEVAINVVSTPPKSPIEVNIDNSGNTTV